MAAENLNRTPPFQFQSTQQKPHELKTKFKATGQSTYHETRLTQGNGFYGQNTAAAGISRGDDNILSKPRSYAEDRIIQFLRHLSTHFFNYATTQYKAVEVQCMYIPKINCLFINENAPASFLKLMRGQLKQAIITPPQGTDAYSTGRLQRVHRKLTEALNTSTTRYKNIIDDCPPLTALIDLINQKITATQIIVFDTLNQEIMPNNIYLYDNLEDKIKGTSKHAEQYHGDLLYSIQHLSALHGSTAYIAGVKRPCQTCFGSLLALEEELNNKIKLKFGKNPGNLWIAQHVFQKERAVTCTCQKVIHEQSFYATYNHLTGNSVTDFDTDSDSDYEKRKKPSDDTDETESADEAEEKASSPPTLKRQKSSDSLIPAPTFSSSSSSPSQMSIDLTKIVKNS